MPDLVKMGRLAFRQEGSHWNAYYALADTFEGAIWIGSIAMRFVENEAYRELFMLLMRECFSDLVEEVCGHRPEFPDGPQPAPPHERTGEA